ncbi:GGDEF domain-containing protein [Spongisporangium articulatum]|uniref:GGDEF domain-containing protein n=1 Tax=Spongisporangium articulatum TaxID=3362603 RepID=A0ABW8AJ42_9ACTN
MKSKHRAPRGGALRRALRTAVEQIAPYDIDAARRVGAAIIAVFAVSVFVGTQAVPVPTELRISVGYVVPALLLGSAALLMLVRALVAPAMLLFSVLGVVLIAVLNILTHDASAGAQVAFCAPVMFAASQLKPAASLTTLVAAVAAEVTTVLTLNNSGAGYADIAYVSSSLIAIGLLLIAAGRRQYRLVQQLERRAAIDPLTGLVTRSVLDGAVTSALNTAGAVDRAGTAMILIDVDHFKSVNDSFGHPIGDDALAHVAALLVAQVPTDAVVSRLGGDEFAVLLPGCDAEVATAIAEEFGEAVRRSPLRRPGQARLPLSISCGVGYSAPGRMTLRQLYACADHSLYEAKRAGRGRVGPPAEEPPEGATPGDDAGPVPEVGGGEEPGRVPAPRTPPAGVTLHQP